MKIEVCEIFSVILGLFMIFVTQNIEAILFATAPYNALLDHRYFMYFKSFSINEVQFQRFDIVFVSGRNPILL